MESNIVHVSAIICTRNRANLLHRAILSLANQSLPFDCFEIIVVDNASIDNTRVVVQDWVTRAPNLHYVYEPRLGLNCARNRGVREANASIVAFLDDDAYASREWIKTIWETFERQPTLSVMGGPVTLEWEGGSAPIWMTEYLMHAIAYVNFGETARPVVHVAGCNMAISKSSLAEYGGFK
jgi:glycosyltransferase involved in cell wall biosynthesis